MIDLNQAYESTEAENVPETYDAPAPKYAMKHKLAAAAIGIVLAAFVAWPSATPSEKLAEAIRGFDAAKLVQLQAAADADKASATADMQAAKLKAEAASLKAWAAACRSLNATGTTSPESDCSKIKREPISAPEEKREPASVVPQASAAEVATDVPASYLNWESNAKGESQAPVKPQGATPEERAKSMLAAFDFDARYGLTTEYGYELFARVGDRHGVKPAMLICVAKADTMLGTATKSSFNIGNVGNNDRGDVVHYKDVGAGIDAIGRVLNNKYLSHKVSIGSLTPVGGGNPPFYATSPSGNWYNNVRNCLAEIYADANVGPDWNFRK